MNKKNYGLIFEIIGLLMFVISFSSFYVYSSGFIALVKKSSIGLLSHFFNLSHFPPGISSLLGIVAIILSLFFILYGLLFIPNEAIKVFSIIMITFCLLSLSLLHNFFKLVSRSQDNINLSLILIVISIIVYFTSAIILLRWKKLSRIVTVIYSCVLILYFFPLCMYLFFDSSGWGGLLLFLWPHMSYSLHSSSFS